VGDGPVGYQLEQGVNYRYILVVENVFGDSPQSQEIRVAMGSLPDAPTGLVKVENLSTKDSIAVEW
jgi:hypothetical protein